MPPPLVASHVHCSSDMNMFTCGNTVWQPPSRLAATCACSQVGVASPRLHVRGDNSLKGVAGGGRGGGGGGGEYTSVQGGNRSQGCIRLDWPDTIGVVPPSKEATDKGCCQSSLAVMHSWIQPHLHVVPLPSAAVTVAVTSRFGAGRRASTCNLPA